MPDAIERALKAALARGACDLGEIAIRSETDRYILTHRDDQQRKELRQFASAEDVIQIARLDDAGKYRPLKTAPNLCHGWRLELSALHALRQALDYFYPGRLAAFAAWKDGELTTTALRTTLERQSGMYRVATAISDDQIDALVGNFCRSDGGCLRTILWKRDATSAVSSTRLPPGKFDAAFDQVAAKLPPATATNTIPLLCQEACNLLVAECRKIVKSEGGS